MRPYIDIMAGKKGANLKYGEPTRNVCASIPVSLDEALKAMVPHMLRRASYSCVLVEAARIGVEVLAGRARLAGVHKPSAPFVAEGGIQGGLEAPSDSRPILAPFGPFRLVRLIDGNDIELPNSMRSTLAEAERLRDQELVKTNTVWEIRGIGQ